MESIRELIAQAGGAIATHELYAVGMSRSMIRTAIRRRGIRRARVGWFVDADAAPRVAHAVRVGGTLTCAAALAAHGLWSVDDGLLHVRIAHGSSRLRTPHDHLTRLAHLPDPHVRTHWSAGGSRASRILASPDDALADWFSCAPRDYALATLDSLIRQQPDREVELRQRFGVSEWCGVDGRCESGTEMIFYMRMLRLGFMPWRQVAVPGVGRVDFLFGSRLVVEVDGRTFHDSEPQFERDRARDAALSAADMRCLRFSHDQVLTRWAEVERSVRAAVARGDHR